MEPYPGFADLMATRMAFVTQNPRSHMIVSGITTEYDYSPIGNQLWTKYCAGERELQRDRQRQQKKAKVVWRSS